MILSEETKHKITEEYNEWKDAQYGNLTKQERQKLGAFYTPPELTIRMIEKFDDLNDDILDPTCGAGGLLMACVIAGADIRRVYGIELSDEILENVTWPRFDRYIDRDGSIEDKEEVKKLIRQHIHQGDALDKDAFVF